MEGLERASWETAKPRAHTDEGKVVAVPLTGGQQGVQGLSRRAGALIYLHGARCQHPESGR